MSISCFTAYDWSRSYLLPDSVTATSPLRGSVDEPCAYNAARGLLVEVCRVTHATPLGLHYAEEQRLGELLITITASAALPGRQITVITHHHLPLRSDDAQRWLISINDAPLPHEQRRYPPSPPYQGWIVARWLRGL
ncbi:MAG: hypothetical protein ACRDRA_02200 [Pseudonocardiaceae bacterium]